jgi:hypothetical protein
LNSIRAQLFIFLVSVIRSYPLRKLKFQFNAEFSRSFEMCAKFGQPHRKNNYTTKRLHPN